MSTIKNGQILLYCYFNKIIKGPGTSFQFVTLSPRHVRDVCHAAHQYLTKFHFDSTFGSKELGINFDQVAMPMKSRYLESKNCFSSNGKIH